MPTECLFREDAYLTSTPATVLSLTEKGGIVVDRTCFYATSGGQPGDSGLLVTSAGEFPLATAVYKDQLKDEITAKVNEMIKADAEVRARWITDEELEANPGLVKTMSVKPPMGTGRVRLIEIAGYDLQPCGGTHVRHTGEIGAIRVTTIEKKGKQNRRVRIALA